MAILDVAGSSSRSHACTLFAMASWSLVDQKASRLEVMFGLF